MCTCDTFDGSTGKCTLFPYVNQWLKKNFSDCAGVTITGGFLTSDPVLMTLQNVTECLVANNAIVDKRIKEELPSMAADNFIMAIVRTGKDRQECHEKIRVLSIEVGENVTGERFVFFADCGSTQRTV